MHTRHGSRVRWHGRNIEMLSECAGIGLGKAKPAWSWIWSGMWRTTRKAPTGKSAVRKSREMWAFCWRRQRTWWHRTRKWPRYSVSASVQSLLVKLTFRNPRALRPVGKHGATKTPPVEENQVNHFQTWRTRRWWE